MSRHILHFDLDAFFAAVEELLDPSLAGKPVVVGADPRGRGVVSTANYAARRYGLRSAMPIRTAYRLCPHAVFLPVRFLTYREYSRRVFDLVAALQAPTERLSLDEAFVDLSDREDPVSLARDLKARIRAQVGLTASMGLASSKLVAKIASDHGKPDGFVVVPPDQEAIFLAPLRVSKLWGIGPKTGERLAGLGIETVGQLAQADVHDLARQFGPRLARELVGRAHGIDDSPVQTEREAKSISDETTFQEDEADARALWSVLQGQASHCVERLRREGLLARTITLKLRYPDFQTVTRSLSLSLPTDDVQTVAAATLVLMRQTWSSQRRPLRLIGVRLSRLSPPPSAQQMVLFGPEVGRPEGGPSPTLGPIPPSSADRRTDCT